MATQQLVLNARGPGILDGRQVRAMAFVPARERLLDRVAPRRPGNAGWTALVVGGGYSPIAASLRDRGYASTAIDPSSAATALAERDTPGVEFRTAAATGLGVPAGSFDLVYCADTVETTDDLAGVLAQLAAATRAGGTVVLDTVTDTIVAKLIYLVAFQRLPFTRIMPARRYFSDRLRSPAALTEAARRAGIDVHTVVGFEPRSVGSLVRAVLDRRAGRIDDADLPAAAGFRLSADGHPPVVTYFAVGTKR